MCLLQVLKIERKKNTHLMQNLIFNDIDTMRIDIKSNLLTYLESKAAEIRYVTLYRKQINNLLPCINVAHIKITFSLQELNLLAFCNDYLNII